MSTNFQAGRKPKIEKLHLNKETLHNLTDDHADEVRGGAVADSGLWCNTKGPRCWITAAARTCATKCKP